jgi:hypothetical protein
MASISSVDLPKHLRSAGSAKAELHGNAAGLTHPRRPLYIRGIAERGGPAMCRNIKTLFNFEPPATEDEIRASALQFVRKLSGFNAPSQANAAVFNEAVEEVSAAARKLLTSLHTHAPARDREVEAEKAKERARIRFG